MSKKRLAASLLVVLFGILANSLVTYMNSESFAPRTMLGEEDIRSLILKNEGKVIETKATSIYRGLDFLSAKI